MWRRERRWPASAVDVVDYVVEKMSEAAAESFPRSFGTYLVWSEEKSGPEAPCGVIAALELVVSVPGKPVALKVVALARLVKVHGVLRMDDMQGIKPAGLIANLRRTKTMGPGKAIGGRCLANADRAHRILCCTSVVS